MDTNGLEHAAETVSRPRPPSNGKGILDQDFPAREDLNELHEEIAQLRSELDHLRDQQHALHRMPVSFDPDPDHEAADEEGGKSTPSNPDRRGPGLRKRSLSLILGAVVAAMLCVAGVRLWNYLQSYEWTDDAEIDGHLDPISARINGTVVRVYVENTYHVKKGQPLVDLDPRDYQVAVQNAAAKLAEVKQTVAAAQQSYAFTVANLAAVVATNSKAQLDVARYRELLRNNVIARETYDEIVRVGKVDAANVISDRAAVAAASREIGQAKAAVEAAQTSLDQAQLNLSYTHIVAPDSGVVGDKTVEVGQRVQPSEQLLSIVALNHIWITADFRETQLRRMHRGQPVTVHVDTTGGDYKGYIEGMPGATGELFSLLPPENATGNYVKVVQRLPVRILLYPGEDPGRRLRPGMSVEPTVWLDGGPRSLW